MTTFEDNQYTQIYDSWDSLDLVELLLELGVMTKESIIRDNWDGIQENIDDFITLPEDEERGS